MNSTDASAGHLKTIGQRSGSSNRARSGRRHDRQQSNGPLAKHNREQSGPPCNRAIGSPAQSIPSVDHAGQPESCNEYDRALSGNCHNLVQSGSRPTSQGAHAEAAGSGSKGNRASSGIRRHRTQWGASAVVSGLAFGRVGSDRTLNPIKLRRAQTHQFLAWGAKPPPGPTPP